MRVFHDPKGGYRGHGASFRGVQWKDGRQLPQVTARGNLTEYKEKVQHCTSGLALYSQGTVNFPLLETGCGPEQPGVTWSWPCCAWAGGWPGGPPELLSNLCLQQREKATRKSSRWINTNVMSSCFHIWDIFVCAPFNKQRKRKYHVFTKIIKNVYVGVQLQYAD